MQKFLNSCLKAQTLFNNNESPFAYSLCQNNQFQDTSLDFQQITRQVDGLEKHNDFPQRINISKFNKTPNYKDWYK
ncbi:hypothetical protein [Mycoplasma nasistruthionis]|uniref:Uncharacterized protein n=1 Tax=Mycoplasma nasistruthionis TaxID=353852 RepID=A0A5B7XUK3_9MOLU|nr:hypothetical protein [Mycoplasma nasistruthionis]QCZ36546.1 hypothetical protein FG904_00745 [Mycoplasma nasistruthionis]